MNCLQKSVYNKERLAMPLLKLVSLLNLVLFVFSSDKFYNESIFSLVARLLLVTNVTILLLVITRVKYTKSFFINCLLFVLMILEAVFSYLQNRAGGFIEFLILLAGYLAVPVYLLAISNLNVSYSMLGWMRFISWIYIGYFLMMSIAFPSYRIGTNALMFGYSNSNRTGAYMMLVVILSVLVSVNEERNLLWYARKVCDAALLYFIAATQSRTSLMLALFAEVSSLLPVLPRLSKKVIRICIIIPAVFLWAYTLAYKKNWFIDLEILGKTVYSGREVLFVIDTLPISLFGHYAAGRFGGLNVAQSILNTLGVVGLLAYYLFYFRLTSSNLFSGRGRRGAIAIICFSLLMLHGCTEKMLMIAGSVYAGMIGCILVTIKAMIDNEE